MGDGEATIVNDGASIPGWLRKTDYLSMLAEIRVMAEALSLKRLVNGVEEEMNHLQGLKSLNEEFFERIKTRTAEWSTRIKHAGTGTDWITCQPPYQVQMDE